MCGPVQLLIMKKLELKINIIAQCCSNALNTYFKYDISCNQMFLFASLLKLQDESIAKNAELFQILFETDFP